MTDTDKVLLPSQVPLGRFFRLSDFMGCHSVYTNGYQNIMRESQTHLLEEGRALCEHVLDPLLERSRISISYGFISDSLSREIVKYQDPSKPSYHRWDNGAAADIIAHDCILQGHAPALLSFDIDKDYPTSRVISYSESPYICVAVRAEEIRQGKPRHALYENRYTGKPKAKPQYINYSNSSDVRLRQQAQYPDGHDWRGGGFPSYHGGGIKQAHHIRTSSYTMLSDFLYSDYAVANGLPNYPYDLRKPCSQRKFQYVGKFIDMLYVQSKIPKISIVAAYENPAWGDDRYSFEDRYHLSLACPHNRLTYLIEAATHLGHRPTRIDRDNAIIDVEGVFPESAR